jgi:hypothetical protein
VDVATLGFILGFVVIMALDDALGDRRSAVGKNPR